VPLILTDPAVYAEKNMTQPLKVNILRLKNYSFNIKCSHQVDPSILKVVDQKFVSVSTLIPENERVVEALKAGLGVEVPM
jgi:hypothetical protein